MTWDEWLESYTDENGTNRKFLGKSGMVDTRVFHLRDMLFTAPGTGVDIGLKLSAKEIVDGLAVLACRMKREHERVCPVPEVIKVTVKTEIIGYGRFFRFRLGFTFRVGKDGKLWCMLPRAEFDKTVHLDRQIAMFLN